MQTPPPADGPVKPKARLIFARRILPGMVSLLVIALVVAAAALIHIARRIDQDALRQSHFLAGKALQAQRDSMNRSIVDYAFWGDAYAHLNSQVDLDWAFTQANLGPSLYKDFGYEAVLVITSAGDTAYSVVRGELQTIDGFEFLQHGLAQLLARAREAVEEESGVSALLWADGQPALVAAATLTTGGTDIDEDEGPASILLFVDLLDAERLAEIGEQYAIERLRLAPDSTPTDDPRIERLLEDGSTIQLTWTPAQPGRLLLWVTLPILAAVALGAGAARLVAHSPCLAQPALARHQLCKAGRQSQRTGG